MSASPAPEVVSLGCRLNIAESEMIRALLGATEDTVVVNSCAVTNEAVKQTRAAIRRAARARPGARIVVTGCAAEIDPHSFTAMPEVSRVVRNPDKLRPESWGALPSATQPVAFGQHARAFVEVQNGCDHACTFCIIPAGRGPSRSLPAGGVVDQIARAVDAGHNEVVLTGVDLTSYGHDLPGQPTLGSLVERILTFVPALRRLRLSSLDSVEIDDRLFDLVTGEARVMPHLHLSLQAGNDLILKRMKRRHSRAQSVEIVQRLLARRPEIAIGADLIAGFPTEDDAMAADTRALVEDCRIVHAHIFPYSARTGTPAARMPQVPHDLRRARAAALRDAAGRARAAWLAAQVGGRQEVLVERPGTTGHTPGFATVHFDSPAPPGTIAPVRVTGATDTHLIGTRL
ncbi:tRNA (N(6)-L-threonylcarbamoyladenosine(37)-C(2))-methylthiotransferase MtaB [Sphingomonas carotinifaciens]|uniref:tRNA (N(6)-L-threonylcarbamoyladenosine(37)-C(2))- methylthiotransferase MtaB n=1 Tax=Sphingomonas carotinifaciens TaxID=1166323 RepID=UPI0039A03630